MKKLPLYFTVLIFGLIGCDRPTQQTADIIKPNILLVVIDDMGYSDLNCYGSEIKTPNIDKVADRGVKFTDFYVSPLCAPTRSMLLTGLDNHLNGLGSMPPNHSRNQYLQPGYEGYINQSAMTLPEVLKENGYHTYMAGKWHLGHHEDHYPSSKGFEKSFAFLGGGSGHFDNPFPLSPVEKEVTFYVRDKQRVDELSEDFFSTRNYTDEMISFISKQEDDAPFFGYLAYAAPHDPLHVTDDYIDKYKGVYDEGYDAIKRSRLERMKTIGLVDDDVPFNPGTGNFKTWNDLDDSTKMHQARRMEIYAAMIENLITIWGG